MGWKEKNMYKKYTIQAKIIGVSVGMRIAEMKNIIINLIRQAAEGRMEYDTY